MLSEKTIHDRDEVEDNSLLPAYQDADVLEVSDPDKISHKLTDRQHAQAPLWARLLL